LTIAAAQLGIFGHLRAGGASASLAGALAEAGRVHANQRLPREVAAIANAAAAATSNASHPLSARGLSP
jgi:hypothetical protein